MTEIIDRPTITVLGLGAMGTAIAGAAAAKGFEVLAWNRTPRSRDELRSNGIEVVESLTDSVDGTDLVVMCVRDHDASRVLLERVASALAGCVVVNVSTGTPAQATESADHAAELGVRYVSGAVMVPTPMVGTDASFVIYAGSEADLAELGPMSDAMGGVSDIVGQNHSVPAVLDLAMLDIYFAGMYAHLHATALAAAHGIDPSRFLPYSQGIVQTLGASLAGLTSSAERRTYDGGDARVDMCLSFLEHIVSASREIGIDPALAEVVRAASARAMTRWPGGTDWDVVGEDFLVARHDMRC
ncbi:NAD(P)-binding domain-containing protein [Rhodococcus sp. IEGM 1330]|uniref:imine reductase family protein n=1 Tax=Rhodococcus sp. IEGM 1330 TaxID=3082225 RepID=UPI0029548BB1|nr:NAD(P)-binding domain-containing protein [Rhodococcus sp. IEGM 1330]MDV8021488.1 NAD(P)-binding domain-containing protein [Rhodococcus sp. IEGM 1330]